MYTVLRFFSYCIIINEVFLPCQYARTELIKNNQSPQFTKAIEIEYRFEELQKLKFTIYDLDNATVSLGDDDFLGEIECSLGEVCTIAAV